MAQIGAPDMRILFSWLTWPERCNNSFGRVDFDITKTLTFEKPDLMYLNVCIWQ